VTLLAPETTPLELRSPPMSIVPFARRIVVPLPFLKSLLPLTVQPPIEPPVATKFEVIIVPVTVAPVAISAPAPETWKTPPPMFIDVPLIEPPEMLGEVIVPPTIVALEAVSAPADVT